MYFRDEIFKRSLGQLKADIVKANSLVQEANFLSEEMERHTKFSVTLQIPPANLSPNRKVKSCLKLFLTILKAAKWFD
jgi:kinesin family member 13